MGFLKPLETPLSMPLQLVANLWCCQAEFADCSHKHACMHAWDALKTF